ncbi:MAG: type 4a pilus biogenesis protein PilO [Gemmatimonadota bacterium]
MALLPEDPGQQKSLLAIILALAIAAGFYLYVYRPGGEALLEVEDHLAGLELQNQIAESRIGNLQELRDRLAFSERHLAALERLVPSRAEVPAIYEAIATQTQALNLTLVNVTPDTPVADSGAYFMRQTWRMQVEGEYHAVGEFLTRVASFDRIVRPHVESIGPTESTPSGRQKVAVSFGLETYVLPPPGALPPTEEDGDEAG